MPGYEIRDVRGRFGDADGTWDTATKDLGVCLHYSGPPVAESWWGSPLAYIKHICNLHSQRGRFAANWQYGPVAYHEFVFGNVVYRVLNYRAVSPHCGNLKFNRRSLAIHIPVGGVQLPQQVGRGTMLTALQRADDHLRAMGLGRHSLYGHRELNPSLCPGEPVMEQIQRYRQGMDVQPPKEGAAKKPPESPVQSAPSDTVYKVLVGAFSQRSYADATANQLKAKGFGSYVYQSGSYHRVQAGSFDSQQRADALVTQVRAAGWKDAYALAEKA